MIIANRPLNYQALALEEAETEIRVIVQREYFKNTPKSTINELVKRIVQKAIDKIKIVELKKNAIKSLLNFYERQYAELKRLNPYKLGIFIALGVLLGKETTGLKSSILPFELTKTNAREFLIKQGVSNANLYGVSLRKFSQDYFKQNVKPVMERLSQQFPLDPDDVSGRMSLRGKAELEVRYQHNLDMVEDLKKDGNKLVICSTHADCSERCAKWQGRVYSLDGTSGTTNDGRTYVPLEIATDVFYTTKKGKTYKNGLLGFNCRHYLVPYKSGFKFPKPNAKEERRQYAITEEQRRLERNVIKWKTEALTYKETDKDRYRFAKKKAQEYNKAYIEFSKANGRAYYPSRTKII